ncbi:hypothetical protein [Hymenobacter siberiensis]|uniref:hypothetical protein n=1 Tax=Hymenobacter siberiensis TaxID=2848396 RepID=UPI001C1E445A|nr:hypothetical protein [Hymenobacter siberiensis]
MEDRKVLTWIDQVLSSRDDDITLPEFIAKLQQIADDNKTDTLFEQLVVRLSAEDDMGDAWADLTVYGVRPETDFERQRRLQQQQRQVDFKQRELERLQKELADLKAETA